MELTPSRRPQFVRLGIEKQPLILVRLSPVRLNMEKLFKVPVWIPQFYDRNNAGISVEIHIQWKTTTKNRVWDTNFHLKIYTSILEGISRFQMTFFHFPRDIFSLRDCQQIYSRLKLVLNQAIGVKNICRGGLFYKSWLQLV